MRAALDSASTARSHEAEFGDRWAVCAQHEIDHLNGRLFIDYLSGGEADDDHLADEEAEAREGAGLSPARRPAMRLIFMGTPDFVGPRARRARRRPATTSPASSASRRGPAAAASSRARARSRSAPKRSASRSRPPASLRDPAEQAALAALGADVAVVVAYGLILPRAVLAAPARGCLNIHASLLPRWRGAAPIQRAIMAGDAETGISIMAMEAGLDTGPVLLARGDRRSAPATPPAPCTTGSPRSAPG